MITPILVVITSIGNCTENVTYQAKNQANLAWTDELWMKEKLTIGYFCKFEQATITMKLLLDIQDDKASFIVEMLKNFKYVKTKPLTAYKSEVLEGLKEGIDEMQLIKEGKLKGIPAKELLDEL